MDRTNHCIGQQVQLRITSLLVFLGLYSSPSFISVIKLILSQSQVLPSSDSPPIRVRGCEQVAAWHAVAALDQATAT